MATEELSLEQKKKREFVDDTLYRYIKVPLGIDYPDNWDQIVDFCLDTMNETTDRLGYYETDVHKAFKKFLESKSINE